MCSVNIHFLPPFPLNFLAKLLSARLFLLSLGRGGEGEGEEGSSWRTTLAGPGSWSGGESQKLILRGF